MPDPHNTPAMQQYYRFKKRHPGCVLLFRIGDFYEMFNEDAVSVSKAIGLTLTQRIEGIPMAGVPHHQLENYLRRLTAKGFRVAVCEQLVEASAAKGIVPRAVTRVITPGTVVDEALLEGDGAVAVAAVVELTPEAQATGALPEAHIALALADVSTGEFVLIECGARALVDELLRHGVREVLFAQGSPTDDTAPAWLAEACAPLRAAPLARPGWHFRPQESLEALREHYGVRTLAGFGLRDDEPLIAPAGALLRYLQETQTIAADEAREVQQATGVALRRGSLGHLRPPRKELRTAHLVIDAVSLRALEVDRALRDGAAASGASAAPTDGTLLGVFTLAGAGRGACRTPMGRRRLRAWLVQPLRDGAAIAQRHAGVQHLCLERTLAEKLGDCLAGVQDVARICGRVSLARATPRDLVALAHSVRSASIVADALGASPALALVRAPIAAGAAGALAIAERIIATCVEAPPPHLREGGLVRDGVDAELDEARLLQRDAGAWLSKYQAELIAEHNLPSLRVGYNKVAGYFIELPSAQARTAPPQLKRMQTLRNAERFTTPQLGEFERKVTSAQSRAIEREKAIFHELCDLVAAQAAPLQAMGDALADLDALLAFADKAAHAGWVRPTIDERPILHIDQGRHPVLEVLLGGQVVPNDCALGGAASGAATPDAHTPGAGLAIITGPNMAGKSTYIRMVALLTLLAHAGSFVPAQGATIGLCDRIFTRIGADDALHAGQSTFMVEMVETANILHHAGPRSLVVLDEVGRGTSTLDGLSLAWAIVEHLALPPAGTDRAGNDASRGPRTLFATHYHELTDLEDRLPGRVTNLHVAVREWPAGDDHAQIIFLYRILPGRTDRSYGLHVARLAGMPKGVVQRAGEVLRSLAVHTAGEGAPAPEGAIASDPASKATKPAKGRRRVDTTAVAPAGGHDDGQLALFTRFVPHPTLDALRELKLEQLSPMQAFDELRKMQAAARDEKPQA